MNDSRDPLDSTLRSWRHEPAPAPAFRDEVWARIRSAETAPSEASAKEGNLLHFPQAFPLAACIAIVLSVAAGSGGAFALSRAQSADRMAAAYVRTIDPIQLTSTDHAGHAHP